MAFTFTRKSGGVAESPEALLLDIRTRKVQGLLSHQADVLRRYVDEAKDKTDVALQLPTGSGKTLVGLLIAEWRRQKYGELCVYVCPTNQLVYQVAEQAKEKYGLKLNAFVGQKSQYSAEAKTEYLSGESMAITSYSSLFNTAPYFSQADTIVLDDAHSAENYIASMWSLLIERKKSEQEPLFIALINILKKALTSIEHQRLIGKEQDYLDRWWIEKIPTPILAPLIPEIADTINRHAERAGLQWAWMLLKDHLEACHLYISTTEILIRPFIPPTFSHAPFTSAKHRIYMSATLGSGGELERLSGRKSIYRIEAPAGWDKHGVGRRLFFFPSRSMKDDEALDLSRKMIGAAKKALILVPDDRTAKVMREDISQNLGFPIFDARAIEQSKQPFLQEENAVAIVANRYDGIDFLDDQCRLTIVLGLPRATNLQERFIIQRMGAVSLLNDRILTRIVQAFGRCTRSPTDYAAIVLLGEELFTYLAEKNRRTFLHPELQAELEFGLDQAKGINITKSLENLNLFLAQDAEWQEADRYILDLRESKVKEQLPGTTNLGETAADEVRYQEAMWSRDYEQALDLCKSVIGKLRDKELKPYRALWEYFAGCAAWYADQGRSSGFEKIAKQLFREARKSAPTVAWLAGLVGIDSEVTEADKLAASTNCNIERIENTFERLGILHDGRYAEEERMIIQKLQQSEHKAFEDGHKMLGAILGFDSGKKESNGSPDPWWIVNDSLCFVFEDYSECQELGELDVKKARQVASHPNWVRDNLPIKKNSTIIPILISPIASISKDALPHLNDVILWDLEEFRSWAQQALGAIRDIRRTFTGSGDLVWRANASSTLDAAHVSPPALLKALQSLPKAKDYKISGK